MNETYSGAIPALDLSLTAFDRTIRGIRVIGSWWLDQNGTKPPQPCLVLLHPYRRVAPGRVVPIVIHIADIWKWDPGTPDPVVIEQPRDGGPTWASRTIRTWLEDGLLPGNPMNPADRLAVYDAIVDSLRDLRHMPRLPPRKSSRLLGEISMVNETTGEIVTGAELKA